MSALVRTLQEDGVLNDVGKLYGLAQVATQTMEFSTSLGSIDVMVAMARALRGIPNEDIVFIQFPVIDADPELYAGRVVPNESLATDLRERLQADTPFTVAAGSEGFGATTLDDGATGPLPQGDSEVVEGLVGQTAGDETCAVAR